MNRILIVCGLVAFLAAGSMAKSLGAPHSVCDEADMKPQHPHAVPFDNYETKNYTLTVQPKAGSAGVLEVSLKGNPFKGFVVRASTPGEKNLGKFIKVNVPFNNMNCETQEYVALTHFNETSKSSLLLDWQDHNNGNYIFEATVVVHFGEYVWNITTNN